MPRQSRNLGNTGWAHVILRGINRENLFYDREDYLRFFSTVERFRKECEFDCIAICLMSNHVHMLLGKGDGVFSEIMKKITVSYASYYNQKYDRVGHVFQDRFRSEPIDDEIYLLTVVRYIFQNPQKAGICRAMDYPYTKIQYDGMLSGYFATETSMISFLTTSSNDRCLDYDSANGFTDGEVMERIAELSGNRDPYFLQNADAPLRDRILRLLKEEGLSVRRLSRLTGVNRNIIQRAGAADF